MLDTLFSSVLPQGANFSLGSFLACSLVSLILGVVTACAYAYKSTYHHSFVQLLAVLPVMVQVVIMLVNGNIGTGVAVMGAFSLIRFRSVPGGAREISSIFLTMAIGLATGMGYLALAALFTCLTCLAIFLLAGLDFGGKQDLDRNLRITIPEALDYEEVFQDLLDNYTSKWELVSVRTANMGSLYKLCYRVKLKRGIREKALLDDLRCRNGNLEISCSRIVANEESL